jgi:hypothetical protein
MSILLLSKYAAIVVSLAGKLATGTAVSPNPFVLFESVGINNTE